MKPITLTPALADFAAGRPIRPVGYVGGRPVWPIAGGADDPPNNDDPDDDPDDGGDPAEDGGRGFPADTPVKDMTDVQRAAYYEHQAKRHESRNKDLLKITGGKYGDDLKAELAELEELRDRGRTDGERAVEEAKTKTRAEVRQEFGAKLAAAEFRAALAHVDDERRDEIIEGISLERYLDDGGNVDTDKVKSYAATIAPADKDAGNRHDPDYGGGRRREHQGKSGVAAGAEMFANGRTNKGATATTK